MTQEEFKRFHELLSKFYRDMKKGGGYTLPKLNKTRDALRALEKIKNLSDVGAIEVVDIKVLDGGKKHWLVIDSKGNQKKY